MTSVSKMKIISGVGIILALLIIAFAAIFGINEPPEAKNSEGLTKKEFTIITQGVWDKKPGVEKDSFCLEYITYPYTSRELVRESSPDPLTAEWTIEFFERAC